MSFQNTQNKICINLMKMIRIRNTTVEYLRNSEREIREWNEISNQGNLITREITSAVHRLGSYIDILSSSLATVRNAIDHFVCIDTKLSIVI